MKIQLVAINTKYIHSNLAVYALSAYAREHGVILETCEYTINHDADHILEGLYRSQADVILFSCYLWNITYVNELVQELKRLRKGVEIWLGGPEVSFDSRKHLEEYQEVRGIVRGEGEQTVTQLCQYYYGQGELDDVLGITYRREDGSIQENPDQYCLNLDDLPFPYGDLSEFDHRILYYESSRGCPFSCSYCLSSVDRNLRFKSLPKVYEELDRFLEAKVEQVKFVDRTYNAKVEHALAIWNYLKEHDNGITNFHFEIAADILQEKEILCLRDMRPGLVQLEIGVQSTNPKTIEEIHRVMKVETVEEVTNRLKEPENMNLHLDLIAGLPYETYQRFTQSFDDLHRMRPHQLQLGFLKVLKGSYMYDHAEEYGLVYHRRPPYEIMETNWISFEEILKLKGVEQMVETYYNSGQFSTTLGICFFLRKEKKGEEYSYDFYYRMYQQFEEKGYLNRSHNRMAKYENLYEFLKENVKELFDTADEKEQFEILECLRQAMLFDLYLRENLKSRPEWAGSMDEQCLAFRKKHGAKKHMERLEYVLDGIGFYECMQRPERTTNYVMFDYEMRSPVTGNVKVERI